MLAAASAAVLAASARLSVHSCGLARAGLADSHLEARARLAHNRLTLIVATAAATAALGAAVTAVTTSHSSLAATFLAIIAALLMLRALRERALYRAVAQSISSMIAATVLVGLCVADAPQSIRWLCGALVLIAAGAAWVTHRGPVHASPAVRRAISIVELILGAAVVPGACAAAGMFGGLAQIGAAW
ncbi:MAG: hypothetical protein HY239_02585 [Mycolicibacterium aromaticivorans]|nr:hypothetical protein [Mycolicibacterium aromaticivorans]